MMCRLYTHILSVKCLVVLTFQPDIVLVGFLEISCHIPSITYTVMNWTKVNIYPRSYHTIWSIYQRTAGRVWWWCLFLRRVCWDQRRNEPPQFVTTKIFIRDLNSIESHCYCQYSQPYSASFEITNWIDYLIFTIFCSHTMSKNGSAPETTNMASTGALFGLQQRPDDNVGASYNNAGNTPGKDTQFGQPANQLHPPPPPPGYRYLPSHHHFLALPSSTPRLHWT